MGPFTPFSRLGHAKMRSLRLLSIVFAFVATLSGGIQARLSKFVPVRRSPGNQPEPAHNAHATAVFPGLSTLERAETCLAERGALPSALGTGGIEPNPLSAVQRCLSACSQSGLAASLAAACARLPFWRRQWRVVIYGNQGLFSVMNSTARAVAGSLRRVLAEKRYGLVAKQRGVQNATVDESVGIVACYLHPWKCTADALQEFQVVAMASNMIALVSHLENATQTACPWFRFIPRDAIVLQTEVLSERLNGNTWTLSEYICLLRSFRVWEINRAMKARLSQTFGVPSSQLRLGSAREWEGEWDMVVDNDVVTYLRAAQAWMQGNQSDESGTALQDLPRYISVPSSLWSRVMQCAGSPSLPADPSKCFASFGAGTHTVCVPLLPPWSPPPSAGTDSASRTINASQPDHVEMEHVANRCCAREGDLMVHVLSSTNGWLQAGIQASHATGGGLDVLFAGTETDHRHRVLDSFAEFGGLRFTWMTMLHGKDLAEAVAQSRVVLSLANFGFLGENKLPRVMPLLALGAAILSEDTRPYDDAEWLSDAGAMLSASSECLPLAAASLAASPARRRAMRAAAFAASTAKPQSLDHSIRKLVDEAVAYSRTCDTHGQQ